MADDTHLHVSLHEAWALWFRGKDLKADGDILWGLRMIWWGRISIVVGFLGGLVILVDIIGQEKLVELGGRWWPKFEEIFDSAQPKKKGRYKVFALMFLSSLFAFGISFLCGELLSGVFGYKFNLKAGMVQLTILGVVMNTYISVLFIAILTSSSLAIWLFFSPLAMAIVRILKEDKAARYARIFALSILVVAAHFALLAA